MSKWKVAIVNQRYGEEVNGGSEYFTKQIAEHLKNFCDIEVLTTCALDYDTWRNYYEEGSDIINGIKVRRFPVVKERSKCRFLLVNKLARILHGKVGIVNECWLKQQGPYCPDLIQYIDDRKEDYNIFIFVTYLYYLTVKGLSCVSEKSILIPTAHDEPYIYFNIYKKIFQCPKIIVYLTMEEKRFVESIFDNRYILSQVMGVGIEVSRRYNQEVFRKKYHVNGNYIIYAGRIDIGKNCDEMIQFFLRYKKESGVDIKLVLVGKAYMEIPSEEDIIYLGFISEEDKSDAIEGATFLWLPSEYESLSIAVLEALALERPILVNGKCEVLKGHCEKSQAGYIYMDYKTFYTGMNFLLHEEKKCLKMGENGKKYVEKNYNWNSIIHEYVRLFEIITNGRKGLE